MSEVSRRAVTDAKNALGPNYFGFYKHKIVDLLSPKEDFLSPFSGQDSDSSARSCSRAKVEDIGNHCFSGNEADSCSGSGSLFGDAIGGGLSEFKRERVKAHLKQSVIVLNHEVDEILDQVLEIYQFQTDSREKELLPCYSSASDKDLSKPLCKKQKLASSSYYNYMPRHPGTASSESHGQMDKDFQALFEKGGLQPEEGVGKSRDKFLEKLGQMEQNLEEFLDILMSKCRPMTRVEKQKLRQRIQKLPPKALDRVVDIIRRRKPSETIADEIHIDLDSEDIVTLWRLHYYVETVANANALSL
eukprot:TRINITY_DN20264_c0_g1_i1.p1 TRINITY_DN20264_c0_g1~~TRINITY_DN20264_c0_g1_i1.p1  ORF type:complete len:303 (+),score=58.06 TRINITY_DN20264_c0_g1_i1:176-1084(+)